MGFKGKKWILLLTLAILGLLCVGIGVFVVSRMNADTKTTLERPEGTQVILNLSTFSSVNAFSLDPPARSDLLYYGQDGELLKRHRRGEEVKGDFIVQTGNGDYYFYPSETVLSMAGIEKTFPNEVDTALRIRFGPDDLGYVQQTGTAYALFNVGARKDVYDGQYINVVRFANPNDCYDIVLPYFLDHISFDQERNRFVCVVSTNSGAHPEFEENALVYATISYQESTSRYVLDEGLHIVSDPDLSDGNIAYSRSIVKDGLMYRVMCYTRDYTEETYILDVLVNVYDLDSDAFVSSKLVKEYLKEAPYLGLVSGSTSAPMCARNGKVYAFVEDGDAIVVSDAENVEIYAMPFVFQDAYSIWTPDPPDEPRDSFFESLVSVQSDGNVYVLNVYQDRKVIISRLTEQGFETAYELRLPKNLPDYLVIRSFLLVDPNGTSDITASGNEGNLQWMGS